MSVQISVMLTLLAPCFWPEVQYIVLPQQMESEFHWASEIGWLPARRAWDGGKEALLKMQASIYSLFLKRENKSVTKVCGESKYIC